MSVNILGTQVMMLLCLKYKLKLNKERKAIFYYRVLKTEKEVAFFISVYKKHFQI